MSDGRDVVLFSTADWATPYWTNKQHTAVHLEKLGYRVLYVETIGLRAPMLAARDVARMARRLRDGLASPRRVSDGIWVLSPLALPLAQHVAPVRALNQGLLGWRVRRFLKANDMPAPLVWTYHPFVLEACAQFAHRNLVYHCVDDLAAIPGVDRDVFEREERRLLARADAVFATSRALHAKCSRHNANAHFFGNVADYEHFARARLAGAIPAELAALPQPRLAYVGVLSDFKVDFRLLLEAARMRPGWSWVLIGEEREGQRSELVQALRGLPNVHILGYRPYAVLPDYLRGIDVGLIPSLINDYTRAMFPMKYFEYLAAGVPVIATPLDFTRGEPRCAVAADAAALVARAEELLARGRLSEADSRQALAGNTWGDRLGAMLALIPQRA